MTHFGNNAIRDYVRRGMCLNKDGQIVLPGGKIHPGKTICSGYKRISVAFNKRWTSVNVARIICWLSHGPPPTERHQVDHIDRNRGNDDPANLRWVTAKENQNNLSVKERRRRRVQAIKMTRGCNDTRGDKNGNSVLSVRDIRRIRALCKHCKQKEVAKMFGVDPSTVSLIITHKRWRHT